MHRSRRRLPQLECEPLESRRLLAAASQAGVWTIRGDADADDVIVVDRDPGDATRLRATVNGVVVGGRREAGVRLVRIEGRDGDDTISVDVPGNPRLRTHIDAGRGDDTVTGSDGDDTLAGGPGHDTLSGGRGRDRIWGGQGDDAITGGKGGDLVSGGTGSDSIAGGDGSDRLQGDGGRDTIRAGRGRDTLVGGGDHDTLFGTAGIDRARLDPGEQLIGNESTNPLREINDLANLKSWYIDAAMRRWSGMLGTARGGWTDGVAFTDANLTTTTDGASSPSASTGNHSDTNTQVAGVDEGDVVETDGRHLFVLAGDGVDVLSASADGEAAFLAHVAIEGDEAALLLHGTRLTVISRMPGSWDYGEFGRMVGYGAGQRTAVTVLDVSNGAAPSVLERTEIDGWFLSARAIGGRVLVVAQDSIDIPWPEFTPTPGPTDPIVLPMPFDPAPLPLLRAPDVTVVDTGAVGSVSLDATDAAPSLTISTRPWNPSGVWESEAAYRSRLDAAWAAGVLPRFTIDAGSGPVDGGSLVDAGRTYLPVNPDSTELLAVVAFEVGDDVAGPESATTVAGVSGTVFASTSSLYVAATAWTAWWNETDDAGDAVTTNVYKFDLGDAWVPLVSMGAVPGQVLDQFSLDERDGLLRVATTRWSAAEAGSSSGVYVLRDDGGNLSVVGAVERLAPGERIFSARFVGDRAYVSTFRQIDPFFVIDLSEPSAPRVEGELKVPGFSSYLQPLDDTHVLGVGRDVDPETGRVLGMQVSLFDVSNPSAPVRRAVHTFPGEGWEAWSEALSDHHAVSWFPGSGILALPAARLTGDGATNSLWVLRVDLGAAAGFTVLGEIGHDSAVRRSVRIGEFLYSVSMGEVQSHPLAEPAVVVSRVALSRTEEEPQPILVW